MEAVFYAGALDDRLTRLVEESALSAIPNKKNSETMESRQRKLKLRQKMVINQSLALINGH
jgi:hypothetical protein